MNQPPPDLLELHAIYDVWDLPLPPANTPRGRVAARLRKLALKLLAPVILRQQEYNAANARLCSQLWEALEHSRRTAEDLESRINATYREIEEMRGKTQARIDALRRYQEMLRGEVTAMRGQHSAAVEAILHAIRVEIDRIEHIATERASQEDRESPPFPA